MIVSRGLLLCMADNPDPYVRRSFAVLHKNLERIGDHTTNIAEPVYYMVKGEEPWGTAKGRFDRAGDNAKIYSGGSRKRAVAMRV